MKKLLAVLLAVLMVLAFAACGEKAPEGEDATAAPAADESAPAEASGTVIRLATTTSVNDSGLLPYLLPSFEEASGYTVEVASAGTGVAIGYAEAGDADLLLVHSKAKEEEFIDAGYASTDRLSFMYNYFVICGPADDPAGIADAETAADAFKAIAETASPFCSRGDESGTHNKETNIWGSAEIDPAGQDWYISVGSGMGDTLNKANEMNAYVLTDKATYLSMKDALPNLAMLKAEAEDMKNTYSLIGVNPDAEAFAGKGVAINTAGANALIDWLLSDEAAELIRQYGVEEYGEQLFFLIADAE